MIGNRIETLRNDIASLVPRIERSIDHLQTKLNNIRDLAGDSNLYGSADYWRLRAYTDGMIKMRLIVEQIAIETIALLATSRYTFELLIWFRLLKNDRAYALVYLKQLLTDRRKHAEESLNKVKGEIELFQKYQKEESEWVRSTHSIADEIDGWARRAFCLYANDAKTRGYGYQAHLMETQVVPELEKEIEELTQLKKTAIAQMPKSAPGYKDGEWKWRQKADEAGMKEQYDFLYAYTSRLLHATPASLTTNQKNLEPNEIAAFLEYIFISMLDAIDISDQECARKVPVTN